MKIRIIAQIVMNLPDDKYGMIDPFTLTISAVEKLIKSGKPREINRANFKEKVKLHAEITAERLNEIK